MSIEDTTPDNWVETTLGELANVTTGFPFKSKDYSYSGELRVVRGENVSLKKLRWDSEKYWNHSTEKLKQYFLEAYDIVIGMDGSRIGKNKSSISPTDLPLILAQRVARVKSKKGVFQGFLKYCILNSQFERYIIKIQTGTSIPHISLGQIKDYPIKIPESIEEQKCIAGILTSFDDKIENLQAQNKTLEQTAQTIFKEWFGKYQVGDELPEGWRVGKLSEIADFLNGLALQKYPPISGEDTLPVIKIRELKQGITLNTDKANTNLDKKYIIQNGDVLFSWSGSLEVVIWQNGKGALNQHLFKVSSKEFPKWFYYFWILHHLREFKGVAANKARANASYFEYF